MFISKPTLPPKKGYVEVEVAGVRTYRNIETGLLIDEENDLKTPTELEQLRADVDYIAMETGVEL